MDKGGGLYFSGVTGLVLSFFVRYSGISRKNVQYFGISSSIGDGKLPYNLPVFIGIFTLKSRYFGMNYLKIP